MMFDQIKKRPKMWKCGQCKNFAYLREYWTVSNDFWCAGVVKSRKIRRDYVRGDATTRGGNAVKTSVDQLDLVTIWYFREFCFDLDILGRVIIIKIRRILRDYVRSVAMTCSANAVKKRRYNCSKS